MITIDYHKLASLSAWDIASEFGIHYSGDSNAIEHGGFFYNADNWEAYGYASCIEFWLDPDQEDTLIVSCGTINKPDDKEGAFRCCGISTDSPDTSNIHCQIDCVRNYCGIEPDAYQSFTRKYKLSDWKEWRIWKSVSPLLTELRSI